MSKINHLLKDDALSAVEELYTVGISDHVRGLIETDGADEVVARQYLPDIRELVTRDDERGDPIGDAAHSPVAGIVHRYPDRALLMAVSVCAVYCRFCFRREKVGQGAGLLGEKELDAAFAYIESQTGLREIILSGGDPLVLSARRLRGILERLDGVAHLDIVRIHSRVPVADPKRVDDALCAAIAAMNKPVYIVVHINHARELTAEVLDAFRALRRAGAILLSQSVLLKDVNDSAEALEDLFRALLRAGVKPYYLHHPDRAMGTGHFRVTLARGRAIVQSLRGRLSGLAQPTYVLDIPGGHGKAPVAPSMAVWDEQGGAWRVEDWQGVCHSYEDKEVA